MTDTDRPAWIQPLVGALVMAACGICVNVATDLKTNWVAWLTVLVVTAAVCVSTWLAQRTDRDSLKAWLIMGGVLAVAAGAAIMVLVADTSNADNPLPTDDPSSPRPNAPATSNPKRPKLVQQVASYRLQSSSGLCPTSDKVDLDTARPGHGGQIQVGDYLDRCRADGGLAELIVEKDELHTPNNTSLLRVMESSDAAGYDQCRTALRSSGQLRNRISLSDVQQGINLCIKTDQGNIAQLTILGASRTNETQVDVAFTTWRP